MTPRQSPDGEPPATDDAVALDSLGGIVGAGRQKTAGASKVR